jgi:hypothetical protein
MCSRVQAFEGKEFKKAFLAGAFTYNSEWLVKW